MRFIRKNGRVIPIHDDGQKPPSKIIRIEGGLRHGLAQASAGASGFLIGSSFRHSITGGTPGGVLGKLAGSIGAEFLAKKLESSANGLVPSTKASQQKRRKLMLASYTGGAFLGLAGKRVRVTGPVDKSAAKNVATRNAFAKIMRDNKVPGWWPHTFPTVAKLRWDDGRPHWGG